MMKFYGKRWSNHVDASIIVWLSLFGITCADGSNVQAFPSFVSFSLQNKVSRYVTTVANQNLTFDSNFRFAVSQS